MRLCGVVRVLHLVQFRQLHGVLTFQLNQTKLAEVEIEARILLGLHVHGLLDFLGRRIARRNNTANKREECSELHGRGGGLAREQDSQTSCQWKGVTVANTCQCVALGTTARTRLYVTAFVML